MDAGISPIDSFIPLPGYREITGRQQIGKPDPSGRGITVARWGKSCGISCYLKPGQTWPALRPRSSSIDDQGGPGHVTRRPRRQEYGQSYYLPRFPETPLSNPAHHVLIPGFVFHDLLDQRRGEVRGSEGVDLDVVGSELKGEHLGELDDRSLARRVRGLPLHRHEARGDLGAKSAFQSFGGSRCRRQTRDSRCSTKSEDVDDVGRVHGNVRGYGVVGPHVHPGVARP